MGCWGSPGVGMGGGSPMGASVCRTPTPTPTGAGPGVAWHRGPRSATCHIACPHPTQSHPAPPQTPQDVQNPPKHPPQNPPKPPPHPPQHPLPIHPTTTAPSPASGRHACACLCMRVHERRDGGGGGGCEGCPPTRWVPLIGRGAVQNSPVAMGPTSPRRRIVYKGRRRSGQGQ